ncbi:MAG TPA: CocE/NonD family hydrolase, partial [Candidatus Obscuribacterales bacterium]
LEILPYRKDDTFYLIDYPTYSYLAARGFMVVKVDIRGTGASFGDVLPREYSDQELADAEAIIAALAALPESNGNVAMWGVSWSGFNSLQVAMRRPPALKTIISIHASDDLYHDDVHYIDGVLHLDPYHLFINHELGLPRTPAYKLDDEYFSSRFDRRPWLFTYMSQQVDGEFWRSKSLRQNYAAIDIPVYLIGGLLDGYRSAMVRIFQNLDVPVKMDMGPWDHSCPDDGSPGPNYEYLDRIVRWLDRWLKGVRNGVDRELSRGKQMLLFVRGGHEPDANMETTPGKWRLQPWPVPGAGKQTFYPQPGGRLGRLTGRTALDRLVYSPGAGVAAGAWWGDTTGDMSTDDARSLVYDSQPLTRQVEIIGFPRVSLKVASSAALANWSVRLEDVGPDGKVALVTGALINASQRNSRLAPSHVVPGKPYTVSADLHFTTWTFKPGHRIRLAVSNAQFPMAWPSAELMTGTLHVGSRHTALTLPVVPTGLSPSPRLPKVGERLACPDAEEIEVADGKASSGKRWLYNQADGSTTYTSSTRSHYRIRRRRFSVKGTSSWTTFDRQPWRSMYRGKMVTTIESSQRTIKLTTTILVRSTRKYFHVSVTRTLCQNGQRLRIRTWRKRIRRQFQ